MDEANKKHKSSYEETHKIIDGIEYKVCKGICGEWYPMSNEYFYKNKSNKTDGYHTYCKVCASKKSRQWEIDNPEKYKALNKKKIESQDPKRLERARIAARK